MPSLWLKPSFPRVAIPSDHWSYLLVVPISCACPLNLSAVLNKARSLYRQSTRITFYAAKREDTFKYKGDNYFNCNVHSSSDVVGLYPAQGVCTRQVRNRNLIDPNPWYIG